MIKINNSTTWNNSTHVEYMCNIELHKKHDFIVTSLSLFVVSVRA